MTIAVTGATGFVGSQLIRSLHAAGHSIVAFGRSIEPPATLIQAASYHTWDITQPAIGDFGQADMFVHTAGFVDFWGDPKDMEASNIAGTEHALELARRMGAKSFIYISSASVYDPLHDKKLVAEDAPYAAKYLNHYAVTKVEAEKRVKAASAQFESAIIIRPHAIYGPGDRSLAPQILANLRAHRLLLPGGGRSSYSATHVGNIVYAVKLLASSPALGLQTLNITDKDIIPAWTFLSALLQGADPMAKVVPIPYWLGLTAAYASEGMAKLLGSKKPPRLTVNVVTQLNHESTMSNQRAVELIGYAPPYSYQAGLRDYFAWKQSLPSNKRSVPGAWLGDSPIY